MGLYLEKLVGKFDIRSKGQLMSKCPFGVIVSTKKPTKFLQGFLPYPLKRGGIKKKSLIK